MNFRQSKGALRASVSVIAAAAAFAAFAPSASALVVRADQTPTTPVVLDTANTWNGVGQMIEWSSRPTLAFGLCTGQLVAPRVVLFAAHCVGGHASGDAEIYGGGANANMAFAFNPRNLAGLREWVGLDPSTQPIGETNVSTNFYRVIDVITHPRNADNPFEAGTADLALAVLDTPVEGFDGYNMLFSQLTATQIVELVGYGRTGTTATGQSVSIDWRRRVGANHMGLLASDNDVFATDLFGNSPPFAGWDGANYWNDCDSITVPRPAGDFNILGGSPLANEICIAQGDSGGAMWATIGGQKVAVGVASYGYSFGPSFGHGALSAHTALFPYWDFIVANNAYVHANAKAGGGAWENPATWSQGLNPNYMTLSSGGSLVNALPTTDPASTTGPFTRVGSVRPLPLFPVPASGEGEPELTGSLMVDIDGNEVEGSGLNRAGGRTVQLGGGHAATATTSGGESNPDVLPRIAPEASVAGVGSGFWPVGTTPLSGPGSTNFVPNNTNGAIGTPFVNAARFYDVRLTNAGTVTLSSARTVDRFGMTNTGAGLTINAAGRLDTIMASSMSAGLLINNGIFSPRAFTVTGGKVQGAGTFEMLSISQFASGAFTLNGGVLAPGNSIGTTTVIGNYVQGAGGLLEIELTNGSADLVTITGTATLNGTVEFKPFGANPLKGQSFTFLTAAGGRSGTFATVLDNLPGLLFPTVSYTANSAIVTINASTFCSVAPQESPLCGFLDGIDGATTPAMQAQISALQGIDPSAIGTALASINPSRIGAQGSLGGQFGDLIKGQLSHRMAELGGRASGQQSASLIAATQLADAGSSAETLMMAASAAVAQSGSAAAGMGREGYSLFGAADLGQADTDNTHGVDKGQASAFTAGVDYATGTGLVVGVAASALDGDVNQNYGLGGGTNGDGYAISAFGSYSSTSVHIDAYLSNGWLDFGTERRVMTGPATFVTATGSTEGSQTLAGATVSVPVLSKGSFLASAVGGAYYANLDIDGYTETGAGGWSFIVASRSIDSLKGQLGFEISGKVGMTWGRLTPFARVQVSHEFSDDGLFVTGAFSAAPATPFTVALPVLGDTFGTAAVGLSAAVGDDVSLLARYQSDIARDGQTIDQVSLAARVGF
jgi:uncharacterized protein YhjY with autotransporter beta-barrel domain